MIKSLFVSIFVLLFANCNSLVELRKQEFTAPVKPDEIKSGCYRQVGTIKAVYTTKTETVLVPSTSIVETVPAHKEVQEEKVLEREAYTSCSYNGDIVFCKQNPAAYKTIKIEIEYPAHVKTIQTSEVQKIISKPILVQPEKPDIRKIVCPEEVTSARVKRIQENLKNAGNDPGSMDGKLYKTTMKAIRDYEIKKGFKEEEQSGEDFIMQRTFDILSK